MKINRLIPIMLLLIITLMGCKKDGNAGEELSRDEMNFTAGSSPNTKTVYDKKNPWQINWIEGDQITVFCEQAGNKKQAAYDVTPIAATPHKGTITLALSESPDNSKERRTGLRWRTGKHNVYSVYPSLGQSGGNIKKTGEGKFTFNFPQTQYCSKDGVTPVGGNYMLNPNMYLAYMVAKNEGLDPLSFVELLFKPIATTLEITVRGAAQTGTAELSSLELKVKNLAGQYVKKSGTNYQVQFDAKQQYTTPTTAISDALTPYTSGTVATADFSIKVTGGTAFQLKPKESVTFTVFLPPIKNLDDVEVKCMGSGNIELGKKQILTTVQYASPASKRRITLPNVVVADRIFTAEDYFQWDAQAPYNPADWTEPFGPNLSGYNRNDYDYDSNNNPIAKYSCAGAPTYEEVQMYLGDKDGVYWVTDGPTYMLPDGKVYRTGLMVKKAANIPNFYAGTAPKAISVTPKKGVYQSLKDDYFFLPACGNYDSGRFDNAGTGYYWLSTPATFVTSAYDLVFNSGNADVYIDDSDYSPRYAGFVPLVGFDDSYVPATVEGITISPDTLNIEPGQTGTLTATVTMSDGSTLTPTTGFTWKINSPNGVVTSTKGGVASPSPQILTGNNSTTNTLSLTANANYYGSTTVTVTYGGKSDTAAVNVYRNIPISSYYQWDAWEHYDINNWIGTPPWGSGSPTYNPTTSGKATQSCKDATTKEQLLMYLGAGVYWVEDGPPFKTPDNKIYRKGLLLRKYAKIPAGTAPKENHVTPQKDFSTKSSTEQLQHFFLPACGECNIGSFFGPGRSWYWSSTTYAASSDRAYSFTFWSGEAALGHSYLDDYPYRLGGHVPMIGFDDSYVPSTVEGIYISQNPLNIEPGQTGTLTATVTMSDGSNQPTGFTWKINSPNGVVTSTNGGVVVLGSTTNIVTGNNSTTNTLSLTANANYYGSTTVTVTYGGKSDTVAVNVYRNIPISSYYQWDAWEHYDINNWIGTPPWGSGSPTYNPTSGKATQSCANAPTEGQMEMYLGAGVYWVFDGPPFKLPNNGVYRAGLMVKKSANIPNFNAGTAPKQIEVTPQTDFSKKSSTEQSRHFFLPACEHYYYGYFASSYGAYYPGANGYYWSSTPNATNTGRAYGLHFRNGSASVGVLINNGNGLTRSFGLVPMPKR